MTVRSVCRNVIVATAAAWLSGCGSSPIAPTPPQALTVICPSTVSLQSADGGAVAASYEAPHTVGGTAPVTTSCSAQSGGTFPVGSSTVTCQAADARGQNASCGFVVNVQGPPKLTSTRFLAFGDSLTAGTLSAAVMFQFVSPSTSYPYLLQDRLVARYRLQTPIVINEGNPGENAAGTGIQRFRGVLQQNRPEVVLLMEGTNDLLGREPGADAAINALSRMIMEAKTQGVRVALATIPPQRAGGLRNRGAVAALIPGFNDRIRSLASAEGVGLIDVYDGMKDDLTTIGVDDLHPTERGYDVMATIFFNAVKSLYEQRSTLSGPWR